MKQQKQKQKSAKLSLLKVRDLITSRKNQYNDYYDDIYDNKAGKNKFRPCLVLNIYNNEYYLVTFATSVTKQLTSYSNKLFKKGSQTIKYKNTEFFFNQTDTFIFNKKIMAKSMHKYIGNVFEDEQFESLLNKALELGQMDNENNSHILLDIIDALLAKQFSIADMLIEKQFPNPSDEDIIKRRKIIDEHNDFVNKKKRSISFSFLFIVII